MFTRGSLQRHHYLIAASVYFVLTLALSYPLFLHLDDHIAGRGTADVWQFPWNNFIFRENILSGKDPYFTDRIYHPVGTSLLLHTNTEFNSVLGLLLSPFLSEIGQMNAGLLVSTFLSAFGTYLLTLRLTGSFAGALFAGIAFAFCPFRTTRYVGHINFALTQMLPFALWSFLQMAETGKLRYAILTGLFFAVAYYCNQYYMMFLIISFAFLTIYGLWRIPSWRTRKFLIHLSISGLVAVILLSQIAWHFVQDYRDKVIAQHRTGGGLAAQGSAYIQDYLLPGPMLGLARDLFGPMYAGPHSKVTTGWVTLVLAFAGLFFAFRKKNQTVLVIGLLGILFFLITLGPFLKIESVRIPLPYALLMKVPYMNHVRIPYRAAPMVALPFAVMAGFGLFQLIQSNIRWRNGIASVLFGALIFEMAQIPMKLYRYEVPSVYRELAKKEGGSILTLPFYNNIANAAHQMKYQFIHKKNMLNGRTARATPLRSQEAFLQRIPVAQTFEAFTRVSVEGRMSQKLDIDRAAAPLFRQLFDVRYVALEAKYASRADVHSYIDAVFPDAEILYDKGRLRVYKLPALPPQTQITPDEETLRFFLFSGWKPNPNPTAVCVQNEAKLLLPGVNQDRSLLVDGRVRTRDSIALNGGKAVFKIKDQTVAEVALQRRYSRVRFSVPGGLVKDGRRLLKIELVNSSGELLEFENVRSAKLELDGLRFQEIVAN